jgi:hypothetical protein
MNTTKAHKAVKAARLAISAEKLGNEEEAVQAGATAGRLWAEAGTTTINTLDDEVRGLSMSTLAWNAAVDGWYEAQPNDATQDEVDELLASLRYDHQVSQHALVTRMWAEIQRRRG